MRCANGHEVVFGLLHCQECGRRVGAANLPQSQVRQTMPGDHASGSVGGGASGPVQGRRPPRRRWARWVVALLVVAIAGTVAAVALRPSHASATGVQQPGDDAHVGDCLTALPHVENPSAAIKNQIIDHVTVTVCSRPHLAEVYARIDLSRELGVAYPGYAAVEAAVDRDCQRALAQQQPAPRVAARALTWTAITPGRQPMYAADPHVTCVAYLRNKALVSRLLEPGHGVTS